MTLSLQFNNIPQELRDLRQWVAWKNITFNGNKPAKIPINPITGRFAKVNDPSTWGTYHDATSYFFTHNMDGIGFVFTESDPYIGLDFDNCVSSFINGKVKFNSLKVEEIVNKMNSYIEISPSNKGIHIIVKGKWGMRNKLEGVEIYEKGRYFTFTGIIVNELRKINYINKEVLPWKK